MTHQLFYVGPSASRLHAEYAKQHRVDTQAPLVGTSTIEVAASIADVWKALVEVAAWPRWAPHIEVLRLDAIRADASFTWRLNGIKINAVFAVVDPPNELSWTGTFFGYRAVDRNVLQPVDERLTHVTFEESLAGPLVALVYRPAQLRANHERWLSSLKKYVEGGQSAAGATQLGSNQP